ncbi:MAG: DUF4358 domain-containing protein [Clostridiales bacterium]|nr:DUF4358 domain-containing protein [Clostridiales bacterium]
MKKAIKVLACLLVCIMAFSAVYEPVEVSAASSPSCSTLYKAAKKQVSSGAKKVKKKSSCTFLTSSKRKLVKDFYYATDSKQIYCVCIVKCASSSDAKKIEKQFNTIKSSKTNDTYLTSSQKKVVKAAKVGRSGKYAWYISLATTSSANNKAVKAMKKKL